MVWGSCSGWALVSSRWVRGGGSSSVFSTLSAACSVSRSARAITAMRRPPAYGVSERNCCSEGPASSSRGAALRRGPHPIDPHVLRRRILDPQVGMGGEPSRPVACVEQLRGQREGRGGLADSLRSDQQQRMGELVVKAAGQQAVQDGAVADHGSRGWSRERLCRIARGDSVPDASAGSRVAAAPGRERTPLRRAGHPLHGSGVPGAHRLRLPQRRPGNRSPHGRGWRRSLPRRCRDSRRGCDPHASRRGGPSATPPIQMQRSPGTGPIS